MAGLSATDDEKNASHGLTLARWAALCYYQISSQVFVLQSSRLQRIVCVNGVADLDVVRAIEDALNCDSFSGIPLTKYYSS